MYHQQKKFLPLRFNFLSQEKIQTQDGVKMTLLVHKIDLDRYLATLRWGHFNAMKRFSLRLTEAEYMKLKFYCEEFHVSMNDVIRELVRNWRPEINTVDQEVKQEFKWR